MIAVLLGWMKSLDTQPEKHVTLLAWGVILAGTLQLAWVLGSLLRIPTATAVDGPSLAESRDEARAQLRNVFGQAIPMMLGLGVLQLNTLLDGVIASWPSIFGPKIGTLDYPLEPGAMAAVSFAQRLYQFPLGVYGIAIATAIFPLLARQAESPKAFVGSVRRGLRLVMFLGLPASVGLICVARPMVGALLEGGDFTVADTKRTAFILMGYALGVWAYCMTHVLTRAFYARGEAKEPVRIALMVVGLNVLLNLVLIWTPLKEAGLGISTAVCAMLQVGLLLRRLGKSYGGGVGLLIDDHVRRSFLKTLGATAVMGAVIGLFESARVRAENASAIALSDPWTTNLITLIALVLIGGFTFFVCARLLRMHEMTWLLGRFRNRR